MMKNVGEETAGADKVPKGAEGFLTRKPRSPILEVHLEEV